MCRNNIVSKLNSRNLSRSSIYSDMFLFSRNNLCRCTLYVIPLSKLSLALSVACSLSLSQAILFSPCQSLMLCSQGNNGNDGNNGSENVYPAWLPGFLIPIYSKIRSPVSARVCSLDHIPLSLRPLREQSKNTPNPYKHKGCTQVRTISSHCNCWKRYYK